MSKKSAHIDINLVPKDPFFESVLGRVLKWALSAGRYIIIFTELVVIVSFAARFTLDRQVTDLNSSILQKQSVIESFGTLEEDFRASQTKMDEYSKLEQEATFLENFEYLTEVMPSGVSLDSLVMQKDQILASGTTTSQNAFNLFINNLQLSSHFHNITIDDVGPTEENNAGILFSLRANTREITRVQN